MNLGDWTERFEGTRGLPRPVRDRLLASAQIARYAQGQTVFSPENRPDNLLFLVEGTLRVSQTAESGREIVLYRVEAGESCVLTTACMLAEEAYNAEGTAETTLVAVALSQATFDQLAAEEAAFRKFVFAAYSRRLLDLLRVVDEVAFGRIDVRLATRLLALAGTSVEVCATHDDLARELGTAREVVSRVLQDFQKRGLVSQSRGRVRLIAPERLGQIAESG
ncbi:MULTISPECIES: Crp/Fnr family transcriptional regulator [unclassified Paracoccus (in: a-proteobacteria)]|uniref:Crp/Fnr family transcriptional regulator n=1 Tax=unclassified Paracoccus (in: a-proteobacteria) TaxID=2688777 RepID=UPI0012B3B835|nr:MULTISPECIES: Crp/Fnr family transcriptional regulator [unclassified Paracoccus (in: a-proteobacteria)]UXU73874.1 Crp/Fnr family transcriptional regulator [Paracoccus sp. SMMA_5]UXU79762.1 Crp/Fnr family transcriptional regulator [Paracoccus sp. SMMA_5_TC]